MGSPARNSEGQEGRPGHLSGGTDSPPPVYTIGPSAYVAPTEYNNNETVVIGDPPAWAPGSTAGQMRKEQLPPSYHQLFPSTLGAPLPPIEIVPTHAIQQHVPYGLPQPPRGLFVPPPRNNTFRERMSYIRRFNKSRYSRV